MESTFRRVSDGSTGFFFTNESFYSAFVSLGGGVRYPRLLASLVLRDEMKISVYVGCDGNSHPVDLSRRSVTSSVITAAIL